MGIIISLMLGAIAGWLGGQLFKGSGLGSIGNIIVGVVGGIIGCFTTSASISEADGLATYLPPLSVLLYYLP